MTIKDYTHMINLQHTHTEQMLLKYVNARCLKNKIMFSICYNKHSKARKMKHLVINDKLWWLCKWKQDHPYRILIVGGSGSWKTNALLNLIKNQPDIDKIYLYAKDPYEAKYQFLINKRKSTGLRHFNDPKAFIEYSSDMHNVYKYIDEYNEDKERKILIFFDDLIADMINNKKLNSVVTELFIRGRKLHISLIFITQSYFKVPKDVRLNSTHFFIIKIPNKRELQQVPINHSSDIIAKYFIKIYIKYTAEPYCIR